MKRKQDWNRMSPADLISGAIKNMSTLAVIVGTHKGTQYMHNTILETILYLVEDSEGSDRTILGRRFDQSLNFLNGPRKSVLLQSRN